MYVLALQIYFAQHSTFVEFTLVLGQESLFIYLFLDIKCNHLMLLCHQELEDPLIIIHEKKISSINAIVKVLELALKVSNVISFMLH